MPSMDEKVIKAVRIGDTDAGRVVGFSLKSLRRLAGMTQVDMANLLNIGQAAISKIEHRGDVQISTLERYVAALGARLRIEAEFPADSEVASLIRGAFDPESTDDDQLVFPIFGEDLFPAHRDLVLSVRPRYSDRILSGEKTAELRRRFPVSAPRGTIAYIYSTSPIQSIVGWAQISEVVKAPIEIIWDKYAKAAVIEKSDFDSYFGGLDEGYVLEFSHAQPFARKIDLPELRERFGFEPPQSFLYATPLLRSALKNEHSDIPN